MAAKKTTPEEAPAAGPQYKLGVPSYLDGVHRDKNVPFFFNGVPPKKAVPLNEAAIKVIADRTAAKNKSAAAT